jgi:hypothetical protein
VGHFDIISGEHNNLLHFLTCSYFAITQSFFFTQLELKTIGFMGLGSLHYEHILNALTKREELWRDGPLNDDVSTVKQFCMRVMALLESVKFRTGNLIANDTVAMGKDENKSMVYNSAAGRIHGSQNYPACVNGPIDWAKLFSQGNQ